MRYTPGQSSTLLRLALPAWLLIFLGFAATGILSYQGLIAADLNLAGNSYQNTVLLAKDLLSQWLKRQNLLARIMAERFERVGIADLELEPEVAVFGFVDSAGRNQVRSEQPLAGFKTPQCTTEGQTQSFSGRLYLELCVPMVHQGRALGHFYLLADLSAFYGASLKSLALSGNGYIFILDRSRNPLLVPDAAARESWQAKKTLVTALANTATNAAQGVMRYEDLEDGERIDTFVNFEPLDWLVVGSVLRKDLLQSKADIFLVHGLGFVVVALLVAWALAATLRRVVTEPLRSLMADAGAIASGDLGHDIAIGGHGMVAALGQTFRHMRDVLSEKMTVIHNHNQNLDQMVKERTTELEKASAAIADQAHQSGRAAFATSALHQIGNALVPVKSSLQMLDGAAKDLPVAKFMEINALLAENSHDFARFFHSDPRGNQLLEYYQLLAQITATQTQEMIHLTAEMDKGLEEVINLVSLQRQQVKPFDETLEPEPKMASGS